MIICKKCSSKNIKSRTNYSHGKKSKPMTSFTCQDCGSTQVEVKAAQGFRRNKRY